MSTAMDKALMALSLVEEDEPLILPNLPSYSSSVANSMSLVGRILNPERQKAAYVILNMPRKWGKEGRVRGVALTQEKFQFIFTHEHDLKEVLDKGVQTSNEWPIVLERWIEKPPEDYLQYISVWVQISKLPINYYTLPTITRIAEQIGFVEEVAFDETKSQVQEFVRAKIRIDVTKPLKMAKKVTLPSGEDVNIHFHYERIQRRCFSCQRINHEKDNCPVLIKRRQEEANQRRAKISVDKGKVNEYLQKDDPLFGVLEEEQVQVDSLTGRPKIAKEVLDEMRRYLLASNGEDRVVREERVRSSVKEAEKDPITQRIALRLEPIPMVTKELDKGKGPVFDYGENAKPMELTTVDTGEVKVRSSVLSSGRVVRWDPVDLNAPVASEDDCLYGDPKLNTLSPTGFSIGSSEPCYSGTSKKKPAHRKRPYKSRRKTVMRDPQRDEMIKLSAKQAGKQEVGCRKRKVTVQDEELRSETQQKCLKVVPHEGLPNA